MGCPVTENHEFSDVLRERYRGIFQLEGPEKTAATPDNTSGEATLEGSKNAVWVLEELEGMIRDTPSLAQSCRVTS